MAELLDFTKPHVLRNEAEYTAAVAEIDQLLDLDPPPQSEAYERLELFSVLVMPTEEAHFPLTQLTTPQDVVTFMLEQKGLSQMDLAQWLGGESLMLAFLQGTKQSVTPTNCATSRTPGHPSGSPPQPWRST